tara:strand:+ start:504 stop:704 length:201 start_codon:yes stop_codon:yes gene_type:complete
LNKMELNEKEKLRIELINDMIAATTVIDELWNYHPDNPNQKDVVKEYEILLKVKKDIEEELADLDK